MGWAGLWGLGGRAAQGPCGTRAWVLVVVLAPEQGLRVSAVVAFPHLLCSEACLCGGVVVGQVERGDGMPGPLGV